MENPAYNQEQNGLPPSYDQTNMVQHGGTYSHESKSTEVQYNQPPAYYPHNMNMAPTMNGAPMPQYVTATNNTVIAVQPTAYSAAMTQGVIVTHSYQIQPPTYMCLSCCTIWFINILFGLIAFGFSLASSSAFGRGDVQGARRHGQISMYLNITGIVFTAIFITIFAIVVYS